MKKNTKNETLLNLIELNLIKKIREKRKTSVVLDDDFIPYIVPKISINSSDGKNFNFCEGNERFLNIV